MREFERPLRAYSLNVLGSLAGILLYTGAAALWLPPVSWFVPAALLSALLAADAAERRQLIAISVGLLLMLLPDDSATRRETWSSYQKLALVDGNHVVVNNVGYQTMDVQDNRTIDRISMPATGRTSRRSTTPPRPRSRRPTAGRSSRSRSARSLRSCC
jgi:hypothetical protein